MPLDNISELKRRVPGGKYVLTRAVAERARQLQEGAPPMVPVRIANPLSVAIDEIVAGKVSFQMSDQQAAIDETVEPEEIESVVSTDDILRVDAVETNDEIGTNEETVVDTDETADATIF